MSNYPPGVSPDDPKAPWNRDDEEWVTCPECGGTGWDSFDALEEEVEPCGFCYGEKEVLKEKKEEF